MSGPLYLHETDDLGFPLCKCLACREWSKTMNAQYVARMFGKITRGHDEQAEREDRSQDYPEQMK